MLNEWEKRLSKYLVALAAAVLVVLYFDKGLAVLGTLLRVSLPLILGCIIAYALNIVLKKLERIYFPNSNKKIVRRTRRPVCILLSILLITGILALVLILVIPTFVDAVVLVGNALPVCFEKAEGWLMQYGDRFPPLKEVLEEIDIDWNSTLKEIAPFAASGVGSVFGSAFSVLGAVGNGIINFVIAVIFAVFILTGKERLGSQVQAVMRAFFKERNYTRIRYVLGVADQTFTHFITGQCLEALILGGLCMLGMLLLRLPYAPMVGAVVGITALIPIVGAYAGIVVGTFLILTVAPAKALLFIIFIIVLQQIENNLIYPKVVGSSIGLPGIWVLAAITIGGGIGGVAGMVLGVPVAATVYKLLRAEVRIRMENKQTGSKEKK
jgi:predicted PurR-regulated permease PerM